MRTLFLAAVTALGLSLAAASPAQAQYMVQQYYYPNTAYMYTYPGMSASYYSPYAAYSATPYMATPYTSYYAPSTQYYTWDWYNPYTNQYRTWRWYRRY